VQDRCSGQVFWTGVLDRCSGQVFRTGVNDRPGGAEPTWLQSVAVVDLEAHGGRAVDGAHLTQHRVQLATTSQQVNKSTINT